MWEHKYRDYKPDDPMLKEQLESGKGFNGIEMHDLFGWGESHHAPKKEEKGLFSRLFGGDKR